MGFEFTPNEWLIVGLAALFGLLLGMALAGGGGRKHKALHRESSKRNDELTRENERLRKELRDIQGIPARGEAAHDSTHGGRRGSV